MNHEHLEKKKQYIENVQKTILKNCHKRSFTPMTFRLDKQMFAKCVNKHLDVFSITFQTLGENAQKYRSIYYFKFFYKRNPIIQSIYSEDMVPYRTKVPEFIFSTDPMKEKNF